MKYKKNLFYFLHFIILSYNFFFSSANKSRKDFYSPNYTITNLSNIFLHNYSSSPISITSKELLFSEETNLFSNYSYFLVTSKKGKIRFIYNNESFFSIDFNKKMYKTNIEKTNIINEDKVVLAFEGKLFIVKNNLEIQNFEEFTTPISELVDMTPFSLWFMPKYYFLSNKKYSIVKINNNNSKYNFDIELDLIVFVDNTLICLKDKEQVWNTTITNVYFLNKNEENKIKNNKIQIDELMLIYENNEKLEKAINKTFENELNDTIFIHGYDKIKKKYVKIYDFNTFSHIVHNKITNNIEEQTNNNIINGFEYKVNISDKYDHIDLIIYYSIIGFIIFWTIILIFHSFIFKIFIFISDICKNILRDSEGESKYKKINDSNDNNSSDLNIKLNPKEEYEIMFQNIQSNFMDELEKPKDTKERKRTADVETKLKNIKINKINENQENEIKYDLKAIKKDLAQKKIKQCRSNKTIKRLKQIKKSLNMSSFSNSNTELMEISPTPKAKINNIAYNHELLNTEMKINFKKEELTLTKEKSSPSTSLTRLEKDFTDITLVKKINIGNNTHIILKGKHIIDEEIYAIKISKLTNPNDEQSVINEAKNMTKIHSKHIVEYITCWFDKSLGKFEYLMGDENSEEFSETLNDSFDKNFSSTKNNQKIFQEDNLILKNQISQEQKKDDRYIKQLYEKTSLSENEYFDNKKKTLTIENKFYSKKNENEEMKYKYKSKKNSYIDDSLIKSKMKQKNIPNLNMYFFIQMEYCRGMTLLQFIKNHSKTGIDNKTMYTFTYQIIKSLARIHENKIVHRAINPENIFIDNEASIKIGDFSSAKEIQPTKFKKKFHKKLKNKIIQSLSTGNIAKDANDSKEEKDYDSDKDYFGSTLYWSPEQEQGSSINKKSDIYSVGLILYIMCECYESENAIKEAIINFKKKNIISDKVKKIYKLQYKLILKMTEFEPEDRPDCEKLLDSEEMKNWKGTTYENN